MKKRGLLGIAYLLLFSVLLSLCVSGISGRQFLQGISLPQTIFQGLYILGIILTVLVLVFQKEKRIRTLRFLLAGVITASLWHYFDVPGGMATAFLVLLAIFLIRSPRTALRDYRLMRRVVRRFNQATEAHQRNSDAHAYLANLDQCIQEIGNCMLYTRSENGTFLFREYLEVTKAHILGDLGRFEERQMLLAKLRQEASGPDLLATLDAEETAGNTELKTPDSESV